MVVVRGTPGSGLCFCLLTQHQALSEYRPIWEGRQLQRGSSAMADKKLILIPLIFICLRVWSTVRFVLTLCGSPAVQSPVLVALHVCLSVGPAAPQWQGQIPSLHTDDLRSQGVGQGEPMGNRIAQCPFPVPKQAWLCRQGWGEILCGCSQQPREVLVELTDPGSFSLRKA